MSRELHPSKLEAELSATLHQDGPQPDDNHDLIYTTWQELRVVRKIDLNLMTLSFVLCKLIDVWRFPTTRD